MANNKNKQTTPAPATDSKDDMIAQLQAKNQKVTEGKKKNPDTVTIKLYKDQNIKDDVQVFVNGRQYIIKRGVSVDVPREVFEVLQNQEKMRDHIAAYNEKHEQK